MIVVEPLHIMSVSIALNLIGLLAEPGVLHVAKLPLDFTAPGGKQSELLSSKNPSLCRRPLSGGCPGFQRVHVVHVQRGV